jgi:acetyl esterase/lipase
MNSIEIVADVFGLVCLFSGLLLYFKFPPGIWGGIFWLPKLWADAWSPVLALIGLAGFLLGRIALSPFAIVAGLAGAVLLLWHIHLITGEEDPFIPVFGADQVQQIQNATKKYRLIQPIPPAANGTRDLILQPGIDGKAPLLADLWEPAEVTPRSGLAVIYLHGGAWQAMDKDILTEPLFRRLANQGHVILDVAYPLAPEADLNQMLGQVKCAILWMKDHAKKYKVNPERIVMMGVSGGAHLALMAAYAPDHPAFQHIAQGADMSIHAVISMFGVTDMAAFFEEYGKTTKKQPEFSSEITPDLLPRIHDRTWMDRFMTRSRAFPAYRYGNSPGGALLLVGFMRGTLKEIPDVYREASPITHVGAHCPPTLQIFDDNDFIIDASHGRRLHLALCEKGVPSFYIEYPQTAHGFDQYFGVSRRISPSAQSATYEIERFLALMV